MKIFLKINENVLLKKRVNSREYACYSICTKINVFNEILHFTLSSRQLNICAWKTLRLLSPYFDHHFSRIESEKL